MKHAGQHWKRSKWVRKVSYNAHSESCYFVLIADIDEEGSGDTEGSGSGDYEDTFEVGEDSDEDEGNIDYADNGNVNDNSIELTPYDNRLRRRRSPFLRRQSGEEFSSDAGPDCRVSFNPSGAGCTLRRNHVPLLTRLSSKLTEFIYKVL